MTRIEILDQLDRASARVHARPVWLKRLRGQTPMTEDEQTILSLTRENERLRARVELLEKPKPKPPAERPMSVPGPVCSHYRERDCPICEAPWWKFWLWFR